MVIEHGAVLVILLVVGVATSNAHPLDNLESVECIRYKGDRCVALCGTDILLNITNVLEYP